MTAFAEEASDDSVIPLDRVRGYIPSPLPEPIDQGCDMGGNLVVTFSDHFKLSYGPCERPASITRLWAAMIYEVSHGQCVPHCGPDGEPAPQSSA
jgi:hypothetical protein